MIELLIVRGPAQVNQKKAFNVGQSMTLGRESSNNWVLRSTGISKKHCKLVAMPGDRIEVTDLGSANGTFVNGILIKKHIARPGDVIQLHDFYLQISRIAPRVDVGAGISVEPNAGAAPALNIVQEDVSGGVASPNIPVAQKSKVEIFLAQNIFPLADNLSSQFSFRTLIFSSFMIWASLIVLLTASPVFEQANKRIQEKAAEVASLYARQLVRLNQSAIIDQRYRDLIPTLDSRAGQTLGVLDSKIIDAKKAEIISPLNEMGMAVGSPELMKALSSGMPMVQYQNGLIYATAPIKVGTPEGINETVALAYVIYDAKYGQFRIFDLMEQWLISLAGALVLSLIFLIFVYRWVEGTLDDVVVKIDEGLKSGDLQVSTKMKWPVLQALIDNVSAVWGRSAGDGGGSSTDWAVATAGASLQAAAAYSSDLIVLAWNAQMEKVIGIRANLAVGADIAAASRDVAFETNVRELITQAGLNPWVYFSRDMEFSGRFYVLRVVGGQGAFLVQLFLKEGDG